MKLTPAMERFVQHWGEMGPRWGVNRSVAQIHALLYLAADPLPAEAIAETLAIARSNVSMSLKELQGWGIIRIERIRGDRRDHFTSVQDVWELFRVVLDERKRREVDPTIEVLRECAELGKRGRGRAEITAHERITHMLDFFEVGAAWYQHVRVLPAAMLKTFLKAGARVRRWLGRAG